MNSTIWIVIPIHNRKRFTQQCLISLSLQTYEDYRIIVVDDGSTDGTREMITDQFSNVEVIQGDGSYFWTKAMNVGVDRVLSLAQEEDYVLSLNDDVSVEPEYLERIMEFARQHEQALIGSVVLDSGDHDTVKDGGVRVNWLTAKYRQLHWGQSYRDFISANTPAESVDVLSGRGTLIPVKVFREIGLYNAEKLPHYGADYEFSVRAQRHGYSLLLDYRAVVYAETQATGLNNRYDALSWNQLLQSYFSIRSPYNLRHRWNYARLSCPWPRLLFFYPLDMMRVIGGTLRNQILGRSAPS